MTYKRYSIYISDEKTIKFLDSNPNVSDFIKKNIEDVESGKLNHSQGDLDLKIKEAKLAKILVDTEIKKKELIYWDTYHSSPSPQAKHAIYENVESHYISHDSGRTYQKAQPASMPENIVKDISPYDEKNNRLQCVVCGVLFSFDIDGTIPKAKEKFVDHMFKEHKRQPTKFETEVLKKI